MNNTKPSLEEIMKKEQEKKERRRILTDVFNATRFHCIENNLTKVKSNKIVEWFPKAHLPAAKTQVKVLDKDCVEVARMLSLEGKTCMLNMANATNRGGGVERGAMAQEEELCRRSNLWYGLKPKFYPMNETEFSYQKDVTFFRDGQYYFSYEFNCDVITIAAPCLIGYKPHKFPPNYSVTFEEKVKQALLYPAQFGVKNLVLSALGCGAFRNNPIFVSRLFKKHMRNLPYDKVYFAILDDHNSKANGISNYKTFKQSFKNV